MNYPTGSCVRNAEVRGSNPLISTIKKIKHLSPFSALRKLGLPITIGDQITVFLILITLLCSVPALAGRSRANPLVFISAGQSNDYGRGDPGWLLEHHPTWCDVPANIEYYLWDPDTGLLTREYRFDSAEYWGPEVGFVQSLPTNRVYILVKVAKGGTSLAVDWLPRTGPMYFTLVDAVTQAVNGRTVGYGSLLWMQGESDGFGGRSTLYAERLDALITDLREDLGAPNIKAVVGQMSVANAEGWIVSQAQANVSGRVDRSVCVVTWDLTKHSDNIHFDEQSLITLGRRFAAESPR